MNRRKKIEQILAHCEAQRVVDEILKLFPRVSDSFHVQADMHNRHVVISSGDLLCRFTPEQAREFAALMVDGANNLDGQGTLN